MEEILKEINEKLDYIIDKNIINEKSNTAILLILQGILQAQGVEQEEIDKYIKKVEKQVNKGE